jgi:hypothetical protein
MSFILVSLPILILAFYNVPSADDYTFGSLLNNWIQENGYHILGILKCGIQNSCEYYFKWQGRYSESFFASFMPDIFGCYWIWTIFLYVFFMSGIVFLFYTLSSRLAGKEYAGFGVGIGFLTGTAIAQNVPFPTEAFFWFDGSMAYMFHHTVYIFMCAVAVRYFFTEKKSVVIRYLLLLTVLTLIAAGGNNVTSFINILTWCVFAGIAILLRKKWSVFYPLFLSVVGFLISYLSPGTKIRGGDSSNYTPILLTIRKCFVWTIKQYLFKWITLGILVMLLFLTPILLRIVRRIIERFEFRFQLPFLVLMGDVCFLSAMSCPSFYVLGEPGPGRLRNVIFVNYILLTVLTYAYILGWLSVRCEEQKWLKDLRDCYQRMNKRAMGSLVIITFAILCLGKFNHIGISVEAIRELASGQAKQYYQEAMIRKEIYQDESILDAEVEPYSVKPYLLYFDDITDDPENWKNKGVIEFYRKDSVKLNRYDPEVDYD